MVVIDAGIMVPDDDHPGVDLILPDFSYIVKRQNKLRAIVITHGHEDHTGLCPICSRLSTAGCRSWRPAHPRPHPRQARGASAQACDGQAAGDSGGSHVSMGTFSFDFFAVNHSSPTEWGVHRTPAGNIVHTGDFKLDQTPIDGRLVDYGALTKFAKVGVDLLMSDSTNAETPGVTRSEASVGPVLRDIVTSRSAPVIAASFSSHVHRVRRICDAAVAAGRKVAVEARSMVTGVGIARELGYLVIDDKDLIDISQASSFVRRRSS